VYLLLFFNGHMLCPKSLQVSIYWHSPTAKRADIGLPL
jgi:hypothetical protein